MSAPDPTEAGREIARGLCEALAPLQKPRSSAAALHAARDVAQLLSLEGLDRLLAALEPHADRPWPGELAAVLDRLRRTAARCAAEADLEVFRRAEAELAGLAAEIETLEWSESGTSAPARIHTVRVIDALADLPFTSRHDDETIRRARLAAPTAAALRAALEWTGGEARPSSPFELSLVDDALEVTCVASDQAGVTAAHAVLGPVGGQIGPWLADAAGQWVVRVPLATPRLRFLMVEQGGVKLALPWTSVLRIMMWPADEAELDARARAHHVPLLAPLVALRVGGAEWPVLMIASGLLRGLLIADRLIWRLSAEPHEVAHPGPANLERAVRTDDGEIYWCVDPARLLEPLPLPAFSLAAAAHQAGDERAAISGGVHSAPASSEAAAISGGVRSELASSKAPAPSEAPAPHRGPPRLGARLRVLDERHVVPLPERRDALPAVAPAGLAPSESDPEKREPEPAAPTRSQGEIGPAEFEAPRSAAGPPRERALIVEDSITARVFLSRMLEAHGFETRAVRSADEALRELSQGDWKLVCVDLELPDARGAAWLQSLLERVAVETTVVALVRDRQDRETARAAGVSRALRKPFDEAEVAALLGRLPGRARRDA